MERIDYSRKEYADYRNERRKLNMHVRELDNAFGKTTFKKEVDKDIPFNPILKKSDGVGQDINTLVKSKEGLVREKIMGKRVNFCARSVASPALPKQGRRGVGPGKISKHPSHDRDRGGRDQGDALPRMAARTCWCMSPSSTRLIGRSHSSG
jgi:hypothetical protein